MPAPTLHVLDATTTPDAIEALALLLQQDSSAAPIAVLGHRSTRRLLAIAGIDNARIHWLPSRGCADPTGWRALAAFAKPIKPARVHAWGVTAAIAAGWALPKTPCITSLGDGNLGRAGRWLLMQMLDEGWGWDGHGTPTSWVGLTQTVCRQLVAAGIPSESVNHIPLAVPANPPPQNPAEIYAALELPPEDFPILLLAGDGDRHSRHDYGLWIAGIVQEIFPRVRVIVRENPRRLRNIGLERLLNNMADTDISILAPAELSWDSLAAVSDALLVCADGPIGLSAVLHAMASPGKNNRGLPVIGMPTDVVREIIEDRINGLIGTSLKPRALAACVEELFTHDPLRQQIVDNARQYIAQHTPAAMIAAYQNLYALESPALTEKIPT